MGGSAKEKRQQEPPATHRARPLAAVERRSFAPLVPATRWARAAHEGRRFLVWGWGRLQRPQATNNTKHARVGFTHRGPPGGGTSVLQLAAVVFPSEFTCMAHWTAAPEVKSS